MHTLIGQSHHYHYFIHQWNNDQCQIFIFSFDCHSLLTTFRPRHQPPRLTMLRGFFVASLLALPSSFPNQRLQESCEISHFPKPPMSRQSATLAVKYFFQICLFSPVPCISDVVQALGLSFLVHCNM